MGTRLSCCVLTWLLGTGLMKADIMQSPRHLIRGRGEEVTLMCTPMKGHAHVFWYRQHLEEDLKFMIYLQEERVMDDSGMPAQRFSAEFPREGPSSLQMEPAEPQDSAVSFCASSSSTAVQSQVLTMHEQPPALPRIQQWAGTATCCPTKQLMSSKAFFRLRVESGAAYRNIMEHPSPCSEAETLSSSK